MGNYDYTKIKTGDYDYTKFGKADYDYDYNNHCNRLQMITITIVIDPMPESGAIAEWYRCTAVVLPMHYRCATDVIPKCRRSGAATNL